MRGREEPKFDILPPINPTHGLRGGAGGDHFSVSETEKRGKKRGKEGEKEEGKKEKKRGKRGFFLIGL